MMTRRTLALLAFALLALVTTLLGGAVARAQQSAPAEPLPAPAAMPYRVALPLVVKPGAGPAPAPGRTRPAPNPARVGVTPDAPLAAEATIGPEGGSLSAAAADGTTFELVIPPGALDAAETIRLTPANLGGLPFAAGNLGAVLIEPAGLDLLAPAVLTISPALGASTPLSALAFEADGAELHLYPASTPAQAGVLAADGALTLRPGVLRGYGVTSGTAAELAAQAQRGPTRFGDWLAQEIARAGGAQVDVTQAMINQYITNEFDAAMGDPARAERAIAEFIHIDDLLRRHGTDAAREAFGIQTLPFLFRVETQVKAAHQRCVAQKRPSEGLRIARLIARFKSFSPTADTRAFQDLLARCMTFELTFRSTLVEQGEVFTRRISMRASATLVTTGATAHLTGNGAAQVTTTSWDGKKPCETYTTALGGSTFLMRGGPNGLRLGRGSAELTYGFGPGIQAIYKFRCQTPAGVVPIDTALPWDAYYDLMHLSDRVTPGQLAYRTRTQGIDLDSFTGWVYNDTQDLGEVTITEDTQIDLVHKPRP